MICPNCGQETVPGFFCHACDALLTNPAAGRKAGVGRRIAACLLDVAAVWVIFVVIILLSAAIGGAGHSAGGFLVTLFWAGMGYVIFALWFLAQGKTPGKWLLSIRAVDKRNGTVPGLGRMLVRETLGKFISGLFLGLGYVWAVFDPHNQAWHDKIAGTLVLRQQPVKQLAVESGTPTTIPSVATHPRPDVAGAAPPAPVEPVLTMPISAPAERHLFCAQCGAEGGSANFCAQCGASLNAPPNTHQESSFPRASTRTGEQSGPPTAAIQPTRPVMDEACRDTDAALPPPADIPSTQTGQNTIAHSQRSLSRYAQLGIAIVVVILIGILVIWKMLPNEATNRRLVQGSWYCQHSDGSSERFDFNPDGTFMWFGYKSIGNQQRIWSPDLVGTPRYTFMSAAKISVGSQDPILIDSISPSTFSFTWGVNVTSGQKGEPMSYLCTRNPPAGDTIATRAEAARTEAAEKIIFQGRWATAEHNQYVEFQADDACTSSQLVKGRWLGFNGRASLYHEGTSISCNGVGMFTVRNPDTLILDYGMSGPPFIFFRQQPEGQDTSQADGTMPNAWYVDISRCHACSWGPWQKDTLGPLRQAGFRAITGWYRNGAVEAMEDTDWTIDVIVGPFLYEASAKENLAPITGLLKLVSIVHNDTGSSNGVPDTPSSPGGYEVMVLHTPNTIATSNGDTAGSENAGFAPRELASSEPDNPPTEQTSVEAPIIHIALPANQEWPVRIPNPYNKRIVLSNMTGRVCWDPHVPESISCNGPGGSLWFPNRVAYPEQFLFPQYRIGSIVWKTENGFTYFSVNDRSTVYAPGAFSDNTGGFEFDVEEE
jgi:uncharacterized RDD family membrane protein YckC